MVIKDEPEFELLYYMSERDSCPEVADEAFRIFCDRHYLNLVESCRMTLARLRYGAPRNDDELRVAAQELANTVMAEVADSLCKRFTKRPRPGTDGRAARSWLAKIARILALREMASRARDARLLTRRIDEVEEDDDGCEPIDRLSVAELVGNDWGVPRTRAPSRHIPASDGATVRG